MNPNQTTFNTAFVLYVLSCVEFFGLQSALWWRLRLFFFGFDPIDMSDRSVPHHPAEAVRIFICVVSQIVPDHHHFRPDLDMLRDFGSRYPGRLTHRVSRPSQVVY